MMAMCLKRFLVGAWHIADVPTFPIEFLVNWNWFLVGGGLFGTPPPPRVLNNSLEHLSHLAHLTNHLDATPVLNLLKTPY